MPPYGAGRAVQHDPGQDRAHRVLPDPEVQGPPVRGGVPVRWSSPRPGRTSRRPSSWCCSTRPGRPTRPTVRAAPAASALSTAPDAARVDDALRVDRPGRQRVGPAVGQVAGLQPVEQRLVAPGWPRPRRRSPSATPPSRRSPRSSASRVCLITTSSTSNDCVRVETQDRLELARSPRRPARSRARRRCSSSSAPGSAMIVRSWMNDGLSVTAFAASIASRMPVTFSPPSTSCTCQP